MLAITRVHESVTVEGWIPCPVEGPKECRRVHFNADPVETIIFEFPFESVPAEFQVRTSIRVGTVAVSESGAEWLVTETSGPRVTSYTPGIRTLSDGSERLTWGPGGVSYQGGCSLIYRPSPWGTESPAGRTIPLATDECSGRRGGTIAPSIMAIDP